MATRTRRAPFGKVEARTQADVRREARERASEDQELRDAYEAGRADAQPNKPKGSGKVAVGRKSMGKLDRRVRAFMKLGSRNPRRTLLAELVAVLVIVTVDQLAHKQVPMPASYLAPFVVYLVLGFAAELGGDGGARVATGIGMLVLVALVLANAPGIVKAIQVATGQRTGQTVEGGVG